MKEVIVRYLYGLIFLIGILLVIFPFARSLYCRKCIVKKYGVNYNDKRKSLNLYIIPSDWKITELDSCIIWSNPIGYLGHRWKNLSFRGCKLINELDLFAFEYDNKVKQYEKVLEVETLFGDEGKVINITYELQIGSYSKKISKSEADSLIRTLQ